MKQMHAYKIDLTKIEGNGDFACPRCGTKISPDEETEAVYSILGSKVNSSGLEEVVICCNKCSSRIHLTGFSLLQETEMPKEELEGRKKRDKLRYVSHV
jgi:DNA-directed RNA polymerase subunit RPC12/RpoP